MIDLLCAFDLGRIMREVLVDGKAKVEDTTLIHALVGFDGQGRAAEGEFLKV